MNISVAKNFPFGLSLSKPTLMLGQKSVHPSTGSGRTVFLLLSGFTNCSEVAA
jgi:hypothetical protein